MKIEDFWRPFEKEISSFDELVEIINRIDEISRDKKIQFAWRGLVNASWAFHSSIYRRCCLTDGHTLDEAKLAEHESRILVDLHRWGLHSPNGTGRLSVLNQLAILQHYGAPTRLVDISFNAWIGIWFAVEKKWSNGDLVHENEDARLFAIDITGRLINDHDKYRNWEDDLHRPWGAKSSHPIDANRWATGVFAWKPPSLDGRIAAQNGAFLFGGVASYKKVDGKIFQFPKGTGAKKWKIEEGRQACCLALRPHKFETVAGGVRSGALYTFRIKALAKAEIRDRLERVFGYKHATIYPDYTGFSNFGVPYLKER